MSQGLVTITQPIHEAEVERLVNAGLEVRDLRGEQPLSPAELRSLGAGSNAIVCHLTDKIDAAVLGIPPLRVVATVSAGVDHIDCAAARVHGVRITNTPGVLTEATADLAVALILAVARRLPRCDALVRDGTFRGWRLLWEPMGLDVSGATLGIVGMGRIGAAVASRCHFGFDMSVLYVSHSRHAESEAALGARRVGLDELLREADIVSLHAPLTPETMHVIDRTALKLMKPNALLINTARGGLVDEGALGEAIAAGRLGGVGLDVFEHEPSVDPRLLLCRDRVVVAPHVGSATDRTRREMSRLAVDGVLDVLAGRPPQHAVV